VTEEEWEVARRVCTRRQVQALEWCARGLSLGQAARAMGLVSLTSARDHLDAAHRRIARELEPRQ
jgi:hypothetical protein